MNVVRLLVGLTLLLATACYSSDAGNNDTMTMSGAFTGVCLGWERQFYDQNLVSNACKAHFDSESRCSQVEGCEWLASGYCTGFPTMCRTYSEATCATALGCRWYGPPVCEDEYDCNVVMYINDDGCSGVPADVLGACSGDAYINFLDLCGRTGPTAQLDCASL